ncbi:AI-2E family transporter [Halomicroarcula sp. GCM10025324]|uniref:AI-2E family transporter n=1 Tax=Haloarcula TaxID=2237 RepID=UPI0023E8C9CA|nr:AI-2E family transporter [Halomicroarcula sp. ZS-22-S1]
MASYDVDVDWPRAFWIGFGAVLAAVLLFVLYSFIGTFVFGVFLYYATRPLYRRIYGRIRQRTLAAIISLSLLALPIIILLYYTIAIALQEFGRFAESAEFGPIEEYASPYVNVSEVVQNPQALVDSAGGTGVFVDSATQLLDFLGLVGTGLIHGFVMLAFAFYMLRDGGRFAEWCKNYLDHRGNLDRYFAEVDRSFDRVFYGNILNAIVTGAIGAIAFSLVDAVAPAGLSVPYPALTGLLAGAASLIPIIGMKIVYVPMAGFLAVEAGLQGEGWWFVALFVVVALVVVDTIPDLIIRPYVSGGGSLKIGPLGTKPDQFEDQPGLHTGTLMFAYILGPFLFGWYGIFLAPMILVLVVHFARFVLPELLQGRPIKPGAVDPTNLAGTEADLLENDSASDQTDETGPSSKSSGGPRATGDPASE